jgi:predicted TIM-barrel fold metal-dependent hydrolase
VTPQVIDFRVQPPYKSFFDLYFFRSRSRPPGAPPPTGLSANRLPNRSFEQRSMTVFMDELDEAGIGHAVIVGQRASAQWGSVNNDHIAELVHAYPGRFSGVAGIDAGDPDAPAQVADAVQRLGCVGVSVVPGWSDPALHDDSPELMRVYETCAELGAFVVTTSSHFTGPDVEHSRPVHVQRAAMAFPEVTFVVGHGCWPWTVAAVAVAVRCPNVYLMPEFYWYLPNMPGAGEYTAAAHGLLSAKMLFSSCYPTRTVGEAVDHAAQLGLSASSWPAVMYGNAAALLGE